MKETPDIYFHLGLPKVASTFLQRAIFPYLNGIHFHKKHHFKHYKNLAANSLTEPHLFSSEMDRGMEEQVDAILAKFPNAKIILVVRRQDKWIVSRYKYSIRKFGGKRLETFLDLENNQGEWKLEELLFSKKIEYIINKANKTPLILTHDSLVENPDMFISKVVQYTKSSLAKNAKKNAVINKAFNKKQLIILRKYNNLHPYKEMKSKVRLLNKIHYRYRQYLLHTIAFFCQWIPWSFISEKELIPNKKYLEKIKAYYQEDWKRCVALAKECQ